MKELRNSILVVLMLLAGVAAHAQSSQVLNADEFEKKLAATKEKNLVDVRTPGEYSQGHLANAVSIDFYKDDFKQQVGKLDRNKPVFVYCQAGGRSGSATEILTGLGFTKVYDLQGGMNAWKKSSKPLIK